MLVQLKPSEEAFTKLVFNKFKKLDAILLCEGRTEVNVVKAIIKKLNIDVRIVLGLIDCEGIDRVLPLTGVMALLARISRKLKTLSVLVNAETMDFTDRAMSIVNSLRSRELKVQDIQLLDKCDQVFKLHVKTDSRVLPSFVTINGIEELKFTRHCIEDHAVKLILLEGKIDYQEISKYSEAKRVVRGDEIVDIIRNANEEHVKSAFSHIVCLLSHLTQLK